MRNDRFQSRERGNIAYYHLPGLFEFYELYRRKRQTTRLAGSAHL